MLAEAGLVLGGEGGNPLGREGLRTVTCGLLLAGARGKRGERNERKPASSISHLLKRIVALEKNIQFLAPVVSRASPSALPWLVLQKWARQT